MNNVLHVRDIQSPRSHICRKQQATGTVSKAIEVLESLSLHHIGMKWQWSALEQGEKPCQAAHTADAVAEDKCSSLVLLDEVIEIKVLLLEATQDTSFCQGASCSCGDQTEASTSSHLETWSTVYSSISCSNTW
jgi:hypothetical protein